MSSFAPTDRPTARAAEIPASAAGAAPTPLHAPIPVPWPPPLRPLDEAARAAPLELPATAPAPRHEDPPPPDPALRSVSYRTAPMPDEEHVVALPAPLAEDEASSPLRIAGPIVGASLVLLAALVAALSR